MNAAIISGNVTKDIEVRMTQGGKAVASFTVAVRRRFHSEGQPDADFINVVAWGKQAEFAGKWFHKGSRVEVSGSIQTRSYKAQDGSTRYVTEIVSNELGFGESAKRNNDGGQSKFQSAQQAKKEQFGQMNQEDIEVPF